ncbi:TPA: DUF551 domain-containing protein [Klebsiella pneumoniae]|nr:DUF551 domain-containing protein [Klebsiella pneumoniae]HBY8894546.1 DUF551 domain-containing protein [Klebsiella pneumoniae]
MTKSTITRERMEEIRDCCWMDDLGLSMDELSELARMALAAMDSSESVELPLDYLQGHKDGLEWASQLAEANHPDAGDWLYDDPIELAKAIRKGPDMPPVQPVADSEPDRNPVLAYADSYRDMAKQGVESVPIWSVITDLERNIAPLYRHAQQPVVPAELHPDTQKLVIDFCTVLAEKLYKAQLKYGYDADWKQDGWPTQCQAHFHQHIAKGDPRDVAAYCAFMWYHGWKTEATQPVTEVPKPISDRQAIVALESAGAVTPIGRAYKMDWNVCRAAMLAAAPQSPGSEPSTVPGKWIPVSERIPEDRKQVILWDAEIGEVTSGHYSHKTQTFYHCGDAIENEITHWMPLPAAPQEVK